MTPHERAERMVAERLGIKYDPQSDRYDDEALGCRFWPNIGVEGKLWRECVRLQTELLEREK